ncbi:MAG: GMC oxidoreductase [Burkholderiaceae bacterium]
MLPYFKRTEIVLDGRRAIGVRHCAHGQLGTATRVDARREIIVCAGAINTPRLLQLSGIGPADLLARIGVGVRHVLPGVGGNLSDHISVRFVAKVAGINTINELARAPRLWGQIARWLLGWPNMLALSPSLVHWFWGSREGLDRPDLQGVFAPASYRQGYVGMLDSYPGMTCGVWQHRPHSVGHVRARSRDVFQAPEIQPNYLADERDRQALIGGMRVARRLLATPELERFNPLETLPGPDVQTDDELLDYARNYAVSSYHVNGTAKMGPAADASAVVDPQLRVHGIAGLRVADSSVMPLIPSGNTCAATMMIAEKAGDLILSA